MTISSRRSFLERAAAAGIATPLLIKAVAAWGDSIDFRPDNIVTDELFVWPNKLVMRGPGAIVRRCAFVGPWQTWISCLAPGTGRETTAAALVILGAAHCEVGPCCFLGCEEVTSEHLAKAEAWIGGGWREPPKLDWSTVDLTEVRPAYHGGGWYS